MIFNRFTIKEKSAILFLGIFLSFLFLSFTHSHKINLTLKSPDSVSTEKNNNNHDPFLDNSLNCTIHSFINSIGIDFTNTSFSNINNKSNYITSKYESSHYKSLNNKANQLRAPPTK